MSGPLVQSVELAQQISRYPSSFDGSTLRFQLALFSLTVLGCLGTLTSGWMIKEIWRDRNYAHPREPLFALRIILLAASVLAVIRCVPEVVYMSTFREVSLELTAKVLVVKRYADAIALFPAVLFHVLIWLYYYGLCAQLSSYRDSVYRPQLAVGQLKRMGAGLAIIFAISALIAIGKQ